MIFDKLGYRIIIIDSDLIPMITENKCLMNELDNFCHQGRIFICGNPGHFKRLVKKSNGDILPYHFTSRYKTTLESVQNIHYNVDPDLFGYKPKEMRHNVLYLKNASKSVLIDLVKSVYRMEYNSYKEKVDCGLRLVYHAMESCPHQCTYCFADYNWSSPTIILLNAHKKLEQDLCNQSTLNLIKLGYPIHIGSISDLASKVALYFNLLPNAVDVLNKVGARMFIGTKSTLIADNHNIELLKPISDKVIITFSYTNLINLEPNLPYDARHFPTQEIQRLTNNGIRVILLYRPIIPGLNDDMEQISNTISAAKKAGVEQVGIGFSKFHVKILNNIKNTNSNIYSYVKKVNLERIDDNYYPGSSYRKNIADQIVQVCNEHRIQFFFLCQSFLDNNYSELETGCCICKRKYWIRKKESS
jgi:DNA repair photolyase